MKRFVIKMVILFLIIMFFCIGLIPRVNMFLHKIITFEQYGYLIMGIAFLVFELLFYLKNDKAISRSFDAMKQSVEFKKFKHENAYKEDVNFYYRDIPFDDDLFKVFWIAYQYGIIKSRSNILNALLLKWCNEDRIKFVGKKKYQIYDLDVKFDNSKEEALFYCLRKNVKNKFVKLNMFNYNVIMKKIDEILMEQTIILKNNGKVFLKGDKFIISDKMKMDADIVFGFKNFLLNFGNIDDKVPMDVKIWDEYLIYASLLGIDDKVRCEFSKVNIDYSAREIKYVKFNQRGINFLNVLLGFSYLFYGCLFLVFTGLIWSIYARVTWYRSIEYLYNWLA